MFVIWGSKGFVKDMGDTTLECECPHCHNHVTMRAQQFGKKFTVFFIPLFTISSEYCILCPICPYGKEVDYAEMEKYLLVSTEKSAERIE